MVRSLLQIIQTAQAELGLPQASTVIGNTDVTTQQMYAFANATLDEIGQFKDDGWIAQQFEYILIVNPPTITTGNVGLNSAVITNVAGGTTPFATLPGYFYISGSNIPQGARLQSVDSPTQLTMNMESTGAQNGAILTIAQDTYPTPSDLRWWQNRTWWDRTNRWELLGPDSPQLDQWHRSGIVATGPRRHWRQLGPFPSSLRLWPPPSEITQPLQLVFEYVSNNAVRVHGSSTSFSQYFNNDDDTPFFDDRLLILGVKWRFWEQKGFNWVVKRTEFERYLEQTAGRDGGDETLDLVKRVHPIFVSPANVQDGFFPGPVGPNMS